MPKFVVIAEKGTGSIVSAGLDNPPRSVPGNQQAFILKKPSGRDYGQLVRPGVFDGATIDQDGNITFDGDSPVPAEVQQRFAARNAKRTARNAKNRGRGTPPPFRVG